MMKLFWLLATVGCLGLLPLSALAAAPTNEQAARAAAEEWLPLVDGGKYVQSWEKLDPAFQKKVSKKKWPASLTEIRARVGKLTARKFNAAEYSKELSGAPEGEYVVVRFDCAFEKRAAATEKVVLILGRDLNWRVAGYLVK